LNFEVEFEEEREPTFRDTLLAVYIVYGIFAVALVALSVLVLIVNGKAILGVPYPLVAALITAAVLAPVVIIRHVLMREKHSVIEIPPDEWLLLVSAEHER